MDRVARRLLALIASVLCIWLLKASEAVTLPLAFALLAIAAVWPLRQWLCRWLPDWLATALSIIVLLIAIGAFAFALYVSAAEVLAQLQSANGGLGQAHRELAAFAARHGIMVGDPLGGTSGVLRRVAVDGYRVTAFIVFVVILVAFGLAEVRRTEAKLREWLTRTERAALAETADDIADKVRRYLSVTFVLSVITGLGCWAWARAMGLELAVTWGLLNFVLNFVPIIGNIIGIIPPALYAFAQFDSTGDALIVFAGLAVIQFVISNILNPWLQGRSLSLSPFVILVALAFWGWVWGVGGALLAVPMTSAAAIICNGFQSTRWIALLIAREPKRQGRPDG